MIRKAVITAAGKGTRQYPATNTVQKELFPLVDQDGITKPTIQIIAEQAFRAGIEEICIVVQAGQEHMFKDHFRSMNEAQKTAFAGKRWGLYQSELLKRLHDAIVYVPQNTQDGYGHAVYCAREWVGEEPFLLMLGDHIYVSSNSVPCVVQMLNGYNRYQKSIYGVKQTPSDLLYLFGTVSGDRIATQPAAYELKQVVEKPDVAFARKHLYVKELEPDIFLTFFGMHILTPAIFEILANDIRSDNRDRGEIQLTSAQAELCRQDGAIGLEIDGDRLDMGTPLGYLETQLALGLNGVFSHEVKSIWQKHRKKQ